MASTRYGIINHGRAYECKLKFPSPAARQTFEEKFNAYHASHDHDGDPPVFRHATAAEVAPSGLRIHNFEDVTIDGYAAYEILEYHENRKEDRYFNYKPPTCCVPPLLALSQGGEFIASDTFERHELSAIFGDMPDTDFQSLLESVQRDGFIDDTIKLLDGKVLDGWHRYRAAEELNLLRKLRFQVWDIREHDDGDPKAFVLARNIERRHLTASQRAQIALTFNKRFGHGGDRANPQNEGLKTHADLAKEAGVSVATMERASQIEKEGQAEAVIAGEIKPSEVLKEREANKLRKQKKQSVKSMWDTRIQVVRDYTGDADTELNLHLTLPDLEKGFVKHNSTYADAFESSIKRTSETSFNIVLEKVLASDIDVEALQTEYRAMMTYAGDVRNWQRVDWSPDTNWILPLIEAKRSREDTGKSLRPSGHKDTSASLKSKSVTAEDNSLAFDNFCNTIENLDQAWKDANLPISFEDDFLPAAADRTNFYPDTIKELYEAGKARQQHEEYEDYISWNKTFTIILRGLQERSHWVEALAVEAESEASELLRAQERAITRRQRMWSYFASEIQVKYGKTIQEVSEEDFAKAAAVALGLDTIRVEKVGLEGMEYCFGADKFLLGDIENPPYSLSDCSLADAAMWASRFDLIAIALMNMADWVKTLLEVESEVSDRGPRHTEKTDYEQIQQEHTQRLQELPTEIRAYIPKWIGANPVRAERFQSCERQVTLKLLLNARSLIEHGSERGPDPFFKEEMEELLGRMKSNDKALIEKVCELLGEAESTEQPPASDAPDMNALWDAFNKRYPKWKAKYAESGYKENDLIQASTEAEMLDALRVYRETESERKGKQPTGSLPYSPSDRKGMPTADEVKDMTDLMSQQSYPFARCLRDLLRVPEGDEALPGIDIHAMRNTLSSLLKSLGIDDMNPGFQDVLGGDLLDVFLQYKNVPTEKEQLIALLNTADAILSEIEA